MERRAWSLNSEAWSNKCQKPARLPAGQPVVAGNRLTCPVHGSVAGYRQGRTPGPKRVVRRTQWREVCANPPGSRAPCNGPRPKRLMPAPGGSWLTCSAEERLTSQFPGPSGTAVSPDALEAAEVCRRLCFRPAVPVPPRRRARTPPDSTLISRASADGPARAGNARPYGLTAEQAGGSRPCRQRCATVSSYQSDLCRQAYRIPRHRPKFGDSNSWYWAQLNIHVGPPHDAIIEQVPGVGLDFPYIRQAR